MSPIPTGVILVGRKRPGFDQEWNAVMTAGCVDALTGIGCQLTGAESPVIDDQTLVAAIARIRASGARTLIVLQPSLGNGQLAVALTQHWTDPVVLWATPERTEAEKASSCSLVGQHLWASVLRQAGRPFEFVYGHPANETVRTTVRTALALCSAPARLKTSKIGVVGTHPPGFIDFAADPFVLRREIGVQLQPLSLPQFIDRVRAVDEQAARKEAEEVASLKLPMKNAEAEDLVLSGRYQLALSALMAEEACDALALQCWPELPNVLGQWPYLAISRLTDAGHIVAGEGDADGALTCLAGGLTGAGTGYLSDWLGHDADSITFWHAGIAPFEMLYPIGSENGPSLAHHFNIARPLVVDGRLRAGEKMTVARFWKCDSRYHVMAFEGETAPCPKNLAGNSTLLQVANCNVCDMFDSLCHEGLPHHVALFLGSHADRFRRLARLLGVHWVYP